MSKKTAIILLLILAAQCVGILQGEAFAQQQTECPPECVTDTLEFVTYYPSPYGVYEELRGDKIIIGDTAIQTILESDPPPSNTITFKPMSSDPAGKIYEGSLYYNGDSHKFKYSPDGSSWKDVGGSGMESSDVSASTVNVNTVKGYTKVTINGQSYAMPYYTYGSWLSGSKHVDADCTINGGVLVNSGGNKFCKFSSNSCPSGWSQYNNWSTTKATRCAPGGYTCGWGECTTGYHSWSDAARETCVYSWRESVVWRGGGSCDSRTSTCTAEATEIGCY